MTTDWPRVSIVIPSWNAAHLLGEAIDSALAQTWPNTEVIVIDDGSTDATVEVLKAYGDRIRWETGPNRGACAARNRGLALATGEFVQFLDADDLLLPTKLERQVPHAQAVGESMISIAFGTTRGEHAYFDWQLTRELAPGRDPVDFVLGGVVAIALPLHHATVLRASGGFDESLPCAQEFDLHLRLVCSGLGLAQLPEVLFVQRRQPGSVSSDGTRVLLQKRRILLRALERLRERGELDAPRQRAFATALARAAVRLRAVGHEDEARALFDEAAKLAPNPELLAWSARWRPLVRLFGSRRTQAVRNWLHGLRKGRRTNPVDSHG